MSELRYFWYWDIEDNWPPPTIQTPEEYQGGEPLRSLVSLIGLAVEGSIWTTQRVDTLEPIGDLLHLRYLSLANLRARSA